MPGPRRRAAISSGPGSRRSRRRRRLRRRCCWRAGTRCRFGSLARGDFDGASDADLLLVGGDSWIDSGVFEAAGRNCDIILIAPEALRRGLAEGHPFAVAVAREGVELWRAPGAAPMG